MDFGRMTLEIDGAVGVARLNQPEVMNALSPELMGGFLELLAAAAEPELGIRCLVVTGTGRGFCAGANLQGRGEVTGSGKGAGQALETLFHPLMRRLRGLPFPLVTAVNGAAAGAGMSLALMGDLVLCARSAYFLQAFRRIGLVPDSGSTWLLPRLVGRARALELSLLGERLPAETALAWGLVNRVYDDADLLPEALKLAKDLAAGPTEALAMTRRLYWDSPDNSYEEQLNLEYEMQRRAGDSEDFREGVNAFLEKRPAVFKGS
jgi:2-(1,2-epoxy-1,2-dihydrophenyl)acetyl-CoA isomerase